MFNIYLKYVCLYKSKYNMFNNLEEVLRYFKCYFLVKLTE